MGWKLGGKEQDHELGTERGTRSRHKGTKGEPDWIHHQKENGGPRTGVGGQAALMLAGLVWEGKEPGWVDNTGKEFPDSV